MKVIVNGRNFTIPIQLRMSDAAIEAFKTPVTSNGCGTNWFNKTCISLLERWVKNDLRLACFIHDVEYELIQKDLSPSEYQFLEKMAADANLHINVYTLCLDRGTSEWKALTVARLFHAAVLLFGHKSAGLNKRITNVNKAG